MKVEYLFPLFFLAILLLWILSAFMPLLVRGHKWYTKILFYHFPRYLRPITPQLKPINRYYNRLSPEERKNFDWRVFYFIDATDIVFRHFKPTQLINYNAARYLIASVATEMSLFLTEDCYDAFHKIIIYPDNYYSPITKQYHKGETNPAAGYIVLSWSNLQSGMADRSDGVNLLMHELAHALWLENELFDYDIFDEEALQIYKAASAQVMREMADNDQHFLRKYARTNKEEFFAVSVENFFERPAAFKTALPELYSILAKLLKQDPTVLAS